VMRAAINKKPLSKSPHERRVQQISDHTVTRAGALNTAGTRFSFHIS
jgi:hypothetical protein